MIVTPILLGRYTRPRFLCGFYCNGNATACFLGILLFQNGYFNQNYMINFPQLVWSANRNHPVKVNATLQLGQDGNLVLKDSDGTPPLANLVLFDKTNHAIWQSFDHPTDSLLPGQNLVSGKKLVASISSSNQSQGLFCFTVLNGCLVTYIDTDPSQYYYASSEYGIDASPFYSFDGRTFTFLRDPYTSAAQFMKLGPDGHIRVYQQDFLEWKEESEVLIDAGNCGYPMVCGKYSICTNNGQCNCPIEGNFFRPINRNPDLGCTQLTSISCNSLQYHSLIELKDTTYFAFEANFSTSSNMWLEGRKLKECKVACLSSCSCKAVVWSGTLRKNCLLLNEIFSLMDNWEGRDKTSVFLTVQNSTRVQHQSLIISAGKKSRHLKVILVSTLAALAGVILSISTWFVLFKRWTQSSKAGDILDLASILPGILTRFSYNELKIITESFSKSAAHPKQLLKKWRKQQMQQEHDQQMPG